MLDFAIPAGWAAIATIECVSEGYGNPMAIWTAALITAFSRQFPVGAIVGVALAFGVSPLTGYSSDEASGWLPMIAYVSLLTGLYEGSWRRGLIAIAICSTVVTGGLFVFTDFDPNLIFGLAITVLPWWLGRTIRKSLADARRTAAAVVLARSEQQKATESAGAAERHRIAYELHDALAHSLGEMVVGATVARDRVLTAPALAEAQLNQVAQTGRAGLAETGRLLRLIRDDRNELGLGAAAPEDGDREAAEIVGSLDQETFQFKRSDVALPLAIGSLFAVETLASGFASLAGMISVAALLALVLSGRRRFALAMPAAVNLLILGAEALGQQATEPVGSLLALLLAAFSAGYYIPASRWAQGLLAVLSGFALNLVVPNPGESTLSPLVIAAFVFPFAAAVVMRRLLEQAGRDGASIELAHQGTLRAVEQAASLERARIARELHDVLANSLSVMIVQSSLAAEKVRTQPELATAAVDQVIDCGSAALGELGQLLEQVEDRSGSAPEPPQHSLADIHALADEYRRAGLSVEVELDPFEESLPIGAELSLYRIVQEGLTNALRHAPGSDVEIDLAERGDAVALLIKSGPPQAQRTAAPSGGFGLVGLQERVSLFGGELAAGPTSAGGFEMRVELPITAGDAT